MISAGAERRRAQDVQPDAAELLPRSHAVGPEHRTVEPAVIEGYSSQRHHLFTGEQQPPIRRFVSSSSPVITRPVQSAGPINLPSSFAHHTGRIFP